MATFVLNDESKLNSYGFRIPNKGINLQRFKSNPVMLDQHYNSTSAVLGKWKNIRIEGSQLLAEDDFDEADEAAKRVKGKVDRGYIKGASMGVTFNREQMLRTPDGSYELNKCELYEASIVAVPSNANALRLYVAETGELMTEDQVKLFLSALTPTTINLNTRKMDKIVLSVAVLAALGLQTTDAENPVTLSAAITRLANDYEAEKKAREKAENDLKTLSASMATTLVDEAILAGKITADTKEGWVLFAQGNYPLAAKMFATMPGKKSLAAGGVHTPGAGGTAVVKNLDEFQQLSLQDQLAFKANHPDEYKKLCSH